MFLFTVRDSFPYKRYKSPKHQPWSVIYKNIKWYKTIAQGCKHGTNKKNIFDVIVCTTIILSNITGTDLNCT